jgi:hypothetical protein
LEGCSWPPSPSQEDVDRLQEAFHRSPQKSTIRASLHLGLEGVHDRLHLHDSTGNKTSWVILSYSTRSFILLFPV